MPRGPRLDSPGTIHHVMGKGIDHLGIFQESRDGEDFLDRLESVIDEFELDVYAWALMPDHFHILIRSGPSPISSPMRKLMTGFAVTFNLRHDRHGHVFQNRYKSIVCEEDPYLLELVRYIHLNPLRAHLVEDLEALADYPWSGHSAIMGRIERIWQRTDTILRRFGDTASKSRKLYNRFLLDGIAMGKRDDLIGGGLIRSAGGWAEVLGRRRRKEWMAADERILGSGEFVEKMLDEVEKRHADTLRIRNHDIGISEIIQKVAALRGLSVNEIRSGGLRREIRAARNDIAQLAVKELGNSGAEVARYLGVSSSCINRLVAKEKMSDIARSIAESWKS